MVVAPSVTSVMGYKKDGMSSTDHHPLATNRETTERNAVPKTLRRGIELPEEVSDQFMMTDDMEVRDAYMRLLRDKGWTLQSIADAVGDVSRERARQCTEAIGSRKAAKIIEGSRNRRNKFIIPDLPLAPEKPKPTPKPMPKPETLEKLRELQPLAFEVRYNHTKYRKEAEQYTKLLWKAHTVEGVSIYRLAKLLDVTHGALQSRLVRYGYKETKGKSTAYSPVKYRKVSR